MPVSKVSKVEFIFYKEILNDFIDEIQKDGFIHIDIDYLKKIKENLDFEPSDILKSLEQEDIKKFLYETEKILNFSKKWDKSKGVLSSMSNEVPVYTEKKFESILKSFRYEKIIPELSESIDNLKKYDDEIAKINQKIDFLQPFKELPVDVKYFKDSEKFRIQFIVISKVKWQLIEALFEEYEYIDYYKFSEYDNNIYFVLVTEKEKYSEIFGNIRKFGGEEINIHENSGLVKDIIHNYFIKLNEIIDKREKEEKFIKEKYEVLSGTLKIFYDQIFALNQKREVEKNFISTDYTIYVTGWVLNKDKNRLDYYRKKYPQLEIKVSKPSKDDEPPIALTNSKIIKPYEFLTELYALPKPGEIDPTPLFAPFFAIFFALCLTDAGYGLVLFLAALILGRNMKGEGKKLINLLMQAGIFTMIAGVLTGSYFGTRVELLSPSLQKLIYSVRLLDPMSQSIKLFVLALFLGVIQILFSYLIPFYIYLKNGYAGKAFGDYFSNALILVSIVILLMKFFGQNISPVIIKISWGGFLTGILLLLILSGNDAPTKVEVGLNKFFAIYGITGLMGDVLSYARLLALGLATSVIALVVNILAQLVRGDGHSVVGFILSLIVLIFGHTFNLVINALGGFVHSLRLQYVEFFKQFYEGGGKPFKPFRRVHKFTRIVKS